MVSPWHLPQPPRLPSKPLLPLPPSFFTAGSSSLNARCPYCQLCSRWQPVCLCKAQTCSWWDFVQEQDHQHTVGCVCTRGGGGGGEGGSSEALSIVRQQQRRPTRSLQDARNCQLFPDNTLVVVFFNRCNPANYDGGRLVVAKIVMRL